MRFQPKTEKEIAEANLLPIGEYDFEVTDAVEKQSKAGNDMVELAIKVYDTEGVGRIVNDWLVDTEKAAFKIRHFAEAVGLLPDYERGSIPAEIMVGRAGRCKVSIKKDTTGQYPDKNGIADYIKAKVTNGAAPRSPVTAADLNDDIPF